MNANEARQLSDKANGKTEGILLEKALHKIKLSAKCGATCAHIVVTEEEDRENSLSGVKRFKDNAIFIRNRLVGMGYEVRSYPMNKCGKDIGYKLVVNW